MANQYQIRQTLQDIVDTAFREKVSAAQLERYKKFYVVIVDKRLKVHGRYTLNEHKISIFNLHRPNEQIIITSIHELSHHVDYVKNGSTGHGPEFYDAYKQLLYAALDMGVIKCENVLAMTDSQGQQKVKKMLDDYIPHPVSYKNGVKNIGVLNAFDIKDILKERGFRYSTTHKIWEVEVPEEEISNIRNWLLTLTDEKNIIETGINNVHMEQKCEPGVIADGNTYPARNFLRDEGFFFIKARKYWKKVCPEEMIAEEINRLTEVAQQEEYDIIFSPERGEK